MDSILSLQKMAYVAAADAAANSTESDVCSRRSWFACTSGITIEV